MNNFLENETIKELIIYKIKCEEETFTINDFNIISEEFANSKILEKFTKKEKKDYFKKMWDFVFVFKKNAYEHRTITHFNELVSNACEKSNYSTDLQYINSKFEIMDKIYDFNVPAEDIHTKYLFILEEIEKHNFDTFEGSEIAANVIGVAKSTFELYTKRTKTYENVTGEEYVNTCYSSARDKFDYAGTLLAAGAHVAGVPAPAAAGAGLLSCFHDVGDWIGRKTRGWFF